MQKAQKDKGPVLISQADEALFRFDLTSQLYYRLIDGTCTPGLIESTKKHLGPDQVQSTLIQVRALTESQRQDALLYAKMFR